MTNKQFTLISKLVERRENADSFQHPYNILIHSVLNTVQLEIIIGDYIDYRYPEIQKSLLSNIEKRVFNCPKENTESIYEALKQQLEEQKLEYFKSQRLRKVLELLLHKLDDDFKIDFFNTYFYSRYLNDKKCAINYISFYDKDIDEELLEEYLGSLNIKFLIPIIKEENYLLLSENIEDIWYNELPFYIKKRLIEIIAKKRFSHLEFLKDLEYDLYLLASLIANKISNKKALKEIATLDESKKHYALLNISKEIGFQSISKEIEKYLN